jgi:pantothenate kinase-related protein Tda10
LLNESCRSSIYQNYPEEGKLIIVEGSDGAGKTTLITHLMKTLNIPKAPRACTSEGGPVDDLHGWTTRTLNDHLRKQRPYEINDRFPLLSEPIYGPLVRGSLRSGFDSSWYSHAWDALLQLKPAFIFCLPPISEVKRNVDNEDTTQMDGVVFNINAIYWQYYTLFQRMRGEMDQLIIKWDYTESRASQNLKTIEDRLQQHKESYGK